MSIGAAVEAGRRLLEGTFLDRCAILDATNVPDGSGGSTTELLPRALDVPCRFAQLTETDVRLITGTTYGPATGILQLGVFEDAEEGSYVQNVSHDEGLWLVVGDRTPPSATATMRRLLIREATWAG